MNIGGGFYGEVKVSANLKYDHGSLEGQFSYEILIHLCMNLILN